MGIMRITLAKHITQADFMEVEQDMTPVEVVNGELSEINPLDSEGDASPGMADFTWNPKGS